MVAVDTRGPQQGQAQSLTPSSLHLLTPTRHCGPGAALRGGQLSWTLKVRLWPSPTLGQYPGPVSHPTWSIPCPKPAPDAAPLIAMATPILARLPWLPGPQPQPHPQHQEDPVIWVLGGCHHGRCHIEPGNGVRRADGFAFPHHTEVWALGPCGTSGGWWGHSPQGAPLMAWGWHHFTDHPRTLQICLLPA